MKSFNMIKRQFLIIFGMIVRSKFSSASGVLAGLVMIAMISAPAGAVTFTASGTNTLEPYNPLAASATFDIVGGNLQIILTNTGGETSIPTDVLTGIFFDINNVGLLTPVSAQLNGSTVLFGFPNGSGNVGGEWAYASGLSGAPLGATEGISSAGLGLFGAANFNGSDLVPPSAVDGLNYGIVSASDNTSLGNPKVTGNVPLIQDHVIFTLSSEAGLPDTLDISNVSFQYGTALNEPNISVPEPATMLLLGSGLISFWGFRKKFKK